MGEREGVGERERERESIHVLGIHIVPKDNVFWIFISSKN